MILLAIDPGCDESAWVMWDGHRLVKFGKGSNEAVMEDVVRWYGQNTSYRCAIEMIASYGMAVGAEVFGTCVWIGRFMEAFGPERCDHIKRGEVKMHLCHSMRAKDANIRAALIDRFGGPQSVRKGGPLYKVAGDVWAALAVSVTWWDQHVALTERGQVEG